MDAYDAADLTPATKGLWRLPTGPAQGALVSIIVLNLDGEELLDRLLSSFRKFNTYSSVEFIVVDHGSSDGSLQILRSWSEILPIKIVSRGANYGYSASNNRGACLAAGEFLLFLNNDIIFTDDVIGEMVAVAMDETVGVVGLKQLQPASTPSARRVYHLGVRFGWNTVERRLRPYHVRPNPIDARLSVEAASVPAVTASVMLCRRSEYLAVGGFNEAYFYGLEDVDFCCRMRWRTQKAVICLNSRSALHFKNSTRDRDKTSRRPTEKANRRVLQQRCGYAIRREFLGTRLTDDGSFTGSRFKVAIAIEAEEILEAAATCPAAFGLGEAMRREFGWDVRYLPRNLWRDATELDVYISTTERVRPSDFIDVQPHLTTALWLVADRSETGMEPEKALRGWDILLCPSEQSRQNLPDPAQSRSVLFLPVVDLPESLSHLAAEERDRRIGQLREPPASTQTWFRRAREMQELLMGRLGSCRIAIKCSEEPTSGDPSILPAAIEQALLERGAPVRIDVEADWYGPFSLADDVVIVMAEARAFRRSPDQISIIVAPEGGVGDAVVQDGFDEVVVAPAGGSTSALVEMLMEIIQRRHNEWAGGPKDLPLADPLGLARLAAVEI